MSIQPVKRGRVRPPQNQVPFPIPISNLPPIPTQEGGVATVPPPTPHIGPWWKNPQIPGFLMSVGAALGQPPQMGQNTWGRLAQALGSGYNYILQNRAAQQAAQENYWQKLMELEKLKGEQATTQGQIERWKAQSQTEADRAKTEAQRAATEEKYRTGQVEDLREQRKIARDRLALDRTKAAEDYAVKLKNYRLESDKLAEMKRSNMAQERLEAQRNRVLEAYNQARIAREQAVALKYTTEAAKTGGDDFDPDEFMKLYGTVSQTMRTSLDPNDMAQSGEDSAKKAFEITQELYKKLKANTPSKVEEKQEPPKRTPKVTVDLRSAEKQIVPSDPESAAAIRQAKDGDEIEVEAISEKGKRTVRARYNAKTKEWVVIKDAGK